MNDFLVRFVVTACILALVHTVSAAEHPLTPPGLLRHPDVSAPAEWAAQWIGLPHEDAPNQWTAFRRDFSLDAAPTKATARIAVDSKYWLWINGVLVVREGGLKRGPTPSDTYFDEVDVARHLRAGTNQVAVLVWHFGKHGFSHNSSGRSGLLLQIESEKGTILATDATWVAQLHPAFSDTGKPHPNKRLPESNIRFDARDDTPGWEVVPAGAIGWEAASVLGKAGGAPWNQLVRRTIPQWKWYEITEYTSTTEAEDVGGGDLTGQRILTGRLPGNVMVTPYLEVDAPAGRAIDMRTDNYLGGSEENVRAEYITKEGIQAFECLGWMNGHEVRYRLPADVRVVKIGYRETRFPAALSGTFHCDDLFLNRLREKAVNTLLLTMRDSYMDCPDRERAQWWGDAVLELGEVFYAMDRGADQLTRKGILELIGWQKVDGTLYSPVPSGNWDKDLPLQSLASIGLYGFWHYTYYSGDTATLEAVYPGMLRYLKLFEMAENGLVVPRAGAWPWGDWGDHVDMEVLANVWYYLALQGQKNAAELLGKGTDLPWLNARMDSISQSFSGAFWNGNAYRSAAHTGYVDDRANALAVVAGLVPADRYPFIEQVLSEHEHASPYMEKYVLEALCRMGLEESAQARIHKRYAKMVDHEQYTTLWEGWGIGAEGFGGGTINHAWSGGPLTLMSQFFAGIAPTSLGFRTFAILPQLGTLTTVQATVQSPHGPIQASMTRNDHTFRLTCEVPPGTRALVGIPGKASSIAEVKLNGSTLWSAGEIKGQIDQILYRGEVGTAVTHLTFDIPPGRHDFEATFAFTELATE